MLSNPTLDNFIYYLKVEQMHKIFKLCGSPSEDFWQRTKLPHATSFKPQRQYKRRVHEAFRDFPPTALALVDKLLAIEPEARGSAAAALQNEVILKDLFIYLNYEVYNFLKDFIIHVKKPKSAS